MRPEDFSTVTYQELLSRAMTAKSLLEDCRNRMEPSSWIFHQTNMMINNVEAFIRLATEDKYLSFAPHLYKGEDWLMALMWDYE